MSNSNQSKTGPVRIPPGTLCYDYLDGHLMNIAYRSEVTDHGTYFDFVFNFVEIRPNCWEIDIVRLPDYRGRPTGSATNHWLPSGRAPSGRKICVAGGKEPTTERAAKKLAMGWANLQAEYIKSGRTPDDQIYHRR